MAAPWLMVHFTEQTRRQPPTIRMMRATPRAAVIVVLAFVLMSCGNESRRAHAQRAPARHDLARGRAGATPGPAPGSTAATGIEAFGHPAGRIERAAVSAALREYTAALAADDGTVACSHLAAPLRGQALALNVASSKAQGTNESCARLLTTMFARQPPGMRSAMRRTQVNVVRVAGDRALAVFRQPGLPRGFFPMQLEHGRWEVAALGATTLPSAPH